MNRAIFKHALILLAVALAGHATESRAQPACCAAHGGPSGACSPAGLIMCIDGTSSTCACGSGTSQPPTLGQLAMPDTVALGPINVGTTSTPVPARITNVGALAVTVAAIESDAPSEVIVVGHTCAVVPGGGSCFVHLAFRPPAEGARSARVHVTSNGVGPSQSFLVTGTGFVPTAATPPPEAGAPTLAVIEFVHSEWNHYFVTAVPAELQGLDDGSFAGWKRTGLAFKAWPNGLPGTVSMCRFFGTAFGLRSSHFYTPDAGECADVRANANWSFEGEVFGVVLPGEDGLCPAPLLPLYRLYNSGRDGAPNHRYTLDTRVRSIMVAFGWVSEGAGPLGVVACTAP